MWLHVNVLRLCVRLRVQRRRKFGCNGCVPVVYGHMPGNADRGGGQGARRPCVGLKFDVFEGRRSLIVVLTFDCLAFAFVNIARVSLLSG